MSKMVGLAGASSPLLFARSPNGNPPQGPDPNTRFPLLASCSLKTPDLVALDNSMEQDPCQIVWALLPGPCLDQEEVTPGTLPPWNHLYNNPCFCNTVFYSLVSACVLCTNAQSPIFSWSQYTGLLQCQPADVTTYSQPIPPDTNIPSWASQQLLNGGTFSLQSAEEAAKQAAALPPIINPTPITSVSGISITVGGSTSKSPPRSSALTSQNSIYTILQGSASPISASSSDAHTVVTTTSRRAPSLSRPAFIGASAGLSAAAFVTIVAAIFLFRRDRRLTRAANLAQLSWPPHVNSFGYASSVGLRQPGIAGADGMSGYDVRDPALEPLRPQRLVDHAEGIRIHKATMHRPTPGICEGGVWRA